MREKQAEQKTQQKQKIQTWQAELAEFVDHGTFAEAGAIFQGVSP